MDHYKNIGSFEYCASLVPWPLNVGIKALGKVLRLHIAAVKSLFERWYEECDIPTDIQAPETWLIDDIKFLWLKNKNDHDFLY
jgi:hypothetical protein